MYNMEDIYYTLLGELEDYTAVPGVENLFSPGSLCDREYTRLQEAYERLRRRLGVRDEDPDVEEILDAQLHIQREVAMGMFLWGQRQK